MHFRPFIKDESVFFISLRLKGGFSMKKFFFIGAGSMGEALIQGWVKKEVVEPKEIVVSNRSNLDRLNFLRNTYGVEILANYDELQSAEMIILAMKPKDVQEAMNVISPYLHPSTSILSILAGISIETIEQGLGARPIARAMPNTSATIGLSATGISFNSLVDTSTKERFLSLLEAVGLVMEVEEDQLHAITALSGSGPAYLYYLIEAFEKVGEEFGLPKDVVRALMIQTVAGSAAMLKYVKEEPEALRRKVTSPGGTTEAGIASLDRMNFTESIAACIRSAEQRSRELAKGL
jgi:pyrroline-5-carboxylate reductase